MERESPRSKLLAVLAVGFLVAGCASGSALVTGTRRAPIEPEAVKIYLEPPGQYETIAVVEAASGSGLTKQGSLDYATAELRKQAAKLGANGVLLQTRGTQVGSAVAVPAGTTWVAIPTQQQVVSGLAIWVPES